MRYCISRKFLGDAYVADLWTVLRVARVFLVPGSATDPDIISYQPKISSNSTV